MNNMFKKKWDRTDLINSLDEFNNLYSNRIINDNNGGMKSAHMFPSWFIIKKLKPKYLIESGVWKGLGTWVFEKSSPETKIISIEPCQNYIIYKSNNVKYQTTDFLNSDWNDIDKKETFVFFDDHQNSMERIKYCKENGFKKMIFEDNYPYNQGDCYSPKKILYNKDYIIDKNGYKTKFNKNDEDYNFLIENIDIYQEMPPIFKDEYTRWGVKYDIEGYETEEPLLNKNDINEFKTFYNERFDYTWICYIELK